METIRDTVYAIIKESEQPLYLLNFEFYNKVVIIGATLAGLYFAWQGLKTWRSQLIGTSEYELAKRILKKVLKVRDEMARLRNPWMDISEIIDAAKKEGIELSTINDLMAKNKIEFVYNERWKRLAAALTSMEEDMLEAESLWDDKIVPYFEELKKISLKLHSAIENELRHSIERSRPGEAARWALSKEKESNDKILYTQYAEQDTFGKSIENLINGVKAFLRPKITHMR